MRALFLHFLFSFFLLSMHKISHARDTVTSTQFLKDGETIISSDGSFEMGFFSSPAGSINRYVGIWYKQIPVQTVIWIANRETALTKTTSAVLKIVKPGRLVLIDGKNDIIWSTNATRSAQNPIAQLLESGNLVVRDTEDEDPENFLWQSFDYPTDTFFPGMKLGWNFVTRHEVYVTARKNVNDPASGQFTHHFDPTGYPQIVTKNGLKTVYATGPWNGLRFSGTPEIMPGNPLYKYQVYMNPREAYFRYDIINNSILARVVLTSSGDLQYLTWMNETQSWVSVIKVPRDVCDNYAICGANGICNVTNSPVCGCFENFTKNYRGGLKNWSNGCHRKKPLKCKNGTDGFKKYSGIKLPDTMHSWFSMTMNLIECEHKCLKNCSCTAYSSLDISNGGRGCLLWFNDLIDIQVQSQNGQDIYIRLDSSEVPEPITEESHASSKGKKVKIILGCLLPLTITILLGPCLGFYFHKKSNKKKIMKLKEWLELPIFDLSTISRATNNFSENNKLGEGGFGAVYKGVLNDKQEVAVKRLSRTSTQGVEEFKNEVICIAKLQHRNLVKLLGCCILGEEKLLVYEYMANKSLDTFIFDEAKSKLLDWPKRHSIINGIARGLMYLHQDSRLRVIHRDLKASNVLLDNNMNPKISDFGLARSVGGDATEANASRIMGTYGYISPEYASKGIFSIKSDTFSFGVLLLEIVTGKRNREFSHPDHSLNLIGHAWKLYKENRVLEVIDVHLAPSCDLSQVQRCIHVGLLCVQQHPGDRPTMSSVVTMLSNDSTLPKAKEPGFFTEQRVNEGEYSSSTQGTSSRNECSITILDPR